MKFSHKIRISAVASAASALILAVVFSAVFYFARMSALTNKRTLLQSAYTLGTSDPHEGFDLREVREAHPDVSIAVFDHGNLVGSHGPMLPPLVGFHIDAHQVLLGSASGDQLVVLATNWKETEEGLTSLGLVLALLWLPMVLLVGGVTWLSAQSVFQPLDRLNRQAASISGVRLSERLSTEDRAEFGQFASHLNGMLDRIEGTLRREESFASDAAHEIRTPIALMRARIETTLLASRSISEYQTTLRRLLSELDRLTAIAEALLRSARSADADADPIDIEPICVESIDRWTERFEETGVRLHMRLAPARSKIAPDELRIILDNLLDNALRFSPQATEVVVALVQDGDRALLTVSDQGPGVPNAMISQLFDRFFRAENDRNRASGGAGIGLAVCRKILESRGGTISAHSVAPTGLCIECRLPITDAIMAGCEAELSSVTP